MTQSWPFDLTVVPHGSARTRGVSYGKRLQCSRAPQPARTTTPVMIVRPEEQSKQGNKMHLTKRANPASDVQHMWPAADASSMRKSRCRLRCIMSYDPSNLMLSDPDQTFTTSATDERDRDRQPKRESVQTCGIFRVRVLITTETSPFSSPLAQSAFDDDRKLQGDTLSNVQHPIERKMLESLTFDFGCRATICSVISTTMEVSPTSKLTACSLYLPAAQHRCKLCNSGSSSPCVNILI